jgi:hypothetical protein
MAKHSENGDAQDASGGGQERAEARSAPRKAAAARRAANSRSSAPRRGKSPVALQKHLKAENARLDQAFRSCEAAESADKHEALRMLAEELIIQMTVKQQVLYPALQEAKVEEALINEALVSYDLAKFLLRDVLDGPADDRFRDAKVALLAQLVEHPVAKEEQPRQGLLAKAAGIDDAALVVRMQERRKAFEADRDRGMSEPMPAATFNRQSGSSRHPGEEGTMPQQGPDRDEHGRFMSHDDRHRGRGGRGYGGMEDDDRGRDMQSRGGRSYEVDHDYRGGRGSGRDQGRSGWFGDSQGHSQASRMGWDERRHEGSDRGESGWFGDSRGHADASRRGWETRRREGTDHDSGWHGDPGGHAEASRGGWETRRREGTDHDSGWHGDPEGHSQASRMGWETRRRESGDRYDDDRGRSGGGYESRGSGRGYGGGYGGGYENEGRGSHMSDYDSRGGGRGYGGGGRDHGQGGWFGDSEGHSEASRRGWDSRRHDDDDYRGGRGRR